MAVFWDLENMPTFAKAVAMSQVVSSRFSPHGDLCNFEATPVSVWDSFRNRNAPTCNCRVVTVDCPPQPEVADKMIV
jgi:hypothetical protein